MALAQYLMEGGTAGATLTNATSGSTTGNVAGGTQTFSAATAAHGGLGASFTNAAANGTYRRWPFAASATPTVYSFSGVLTLPGSAWTQTVDVAAFPVSAGSGGNRKIQVNPTGQVWFAGLTNAIGASLTFGQKYRFIVTANGATAQQIKVYQQSSPGVWDQQVGSTGNTTHADFASAVVGVDAGVQAAPASSIIVTVGWDDIQLNDGSTTEIPDYTSANTPPTVTPGAALTVAASSTANLSFAVADDGTVVSRATTFDYPTSGAPTVTNGGTNSPTFTTGAAGSYYLVRHTATDNDGASTSATQEVRVNLAGSATARPLAMNGTGAGTWTIGGGSSTEGAALADESTSTYVESPVLSSTEAARRWRWAPKADQATAAVETTLATDTGTATAKVRIYEGATLRQEWTHTGITTTPANFTDTLSTAAVAAIADDGNLYIEVGWTV